MDKKKSSILLAVLAAICYGVSTPISKILLVELSPVLTAALLYLGAGIGMLAVNLVKTKKEKYSPEAKMTKQDLPYIVSMIVLDIAAPVLLMFGLMRTSAANVSLLNNFEIVTTSVIAAAVFKEAVGKHMWTSIILITFSCMILSFKGMSSFSFSFGSLFVLAACVCWGFENNCTRMLSIKNPIQIVVVKCIGSGAGSLIIVFVLQEFSGNVLYIAYALLLGFFAYGLSIYCYILAQRELGAARASAYYAIAPFIGVGLSFILFGQTITISFVVALVVMIFGVYFAVSEKHKHIHTHEMMEHEHRHNHSDGHHNHSHIFPVEEHSHKHTHESLGHEHQHMPDTHHFHSH